MKITSNKFDIIYAAAVLILLFIVSYPSVSYPPVSDSWEMFYFFHNLQDKPGGVKWLHILNHDPNEHMRYQPLSRIFYYSFHLFFGADFHYFKIFNILFYFILVMLLYRFMHYFIENKFLIAGFVLLFAFLFSHFDILLWASHIYIIAGFILFLSGFISYMKLLGTGKRRYILLTIIFLLLGLWCYESFFLWPFAVIFISSLKKFRKGRYTLCSSRVKTNSFILGAVYFLYYAGYLYTRSLNTYSGPVYNLINFLKIKNFFATLLLVFFNIIYNNFAVNIFPLIPFPLKVSENIYMRGPVINFINFGHEAVVFIVGLAAGLVFLFFLAYLYKKKRYQDAKILGLFLFLLITHPYVTFFCRISTGAFIYNLTEFRYQYTSNAFVILIVAYLVDRFIKSGRGNKIMIFAIMAAIFSLNVFCARKVVNIYTRQLSDLTKILSQVRNGIKGGYIDKKNKIYIDPRLPDYLPHLCWNIEMGEKFIKKGKYRWMFSRKEAGYFSDKIEESAWMVDRNNFAVKSCDQGKGFTDADIILSLSSQWFFSPPKTRQYFNLADYYKNKGRLPKAEKMMRRIIDLCSPQSRVYASVGHFYNNQGNYLEAEKAFKKSLEINPKDISALEGLGACYRGQKKYWESEMILRGALRLDPARAGLYIDLGHLYCIQGNYEKAEQMFRKAVELEPNDYESNRVLSEFYRSHDETQRKTGE